jgi:PadR family transcriptional regulator
MSDRKIMTNRLIDELLGEGAGERVPRVSAKEVVVMRLLSSSLKPLYGLEIVSKSDGEIGRGTVYVTLSRMEDKGFVESEQEQQRPGATGLPRRRYRITGEGARALRQWEHAAHLLANGSDGGLVI